MKLRTIHIVITLFFCFISFGQTIKTPKNLKQAVRWLNASSSDSIKKIIKNSHNDSIRNVNYPEQGAFKTIDNWTNNDNYDSRITKYLHKKGIYYHGDEVILIAFKNYLIYKDFNEEKILKPFQELEIKWNKEDEVRYTTDTLRKNYIPKDLNDSFKTLDNLYDDSTKVKISKLSETEYVSGNYRSGMGLWMRNNWQLWAGSRLSGFFQDNRISNPEAISVVLLESYHRYLNHKDVEFEKQKEKYLKYDEQAKITEQKTAEKELKEQRDDFEKLKTGDILEFNYNYDFSSKDQKEKYMNDNCIAKGILIDKDGKSLTIKVQVTETCGKKGIVIYANYNTLIYNKEKKRLTRPEKKIIEYLKEKKSDWFSIRDWNKAE